MNYFTTKPNVMAIVIVSLLLAFPAVDTRAQTPSSAPAATSSVEAILDEADVQRKAYIDEFKNLLSRETKFFEIFDKEGRSKRTRRILSTFVVYPLSRSENATAEYRSVVSVDGKAISDADKRAEDLFAQVAKVESSQKELEKIQEESSRHDLELFVSGLTLYQGVTLAENLRPLFTFTLEGRDQVAGQEVYVIRYQQNRPSRNISVREDPQTVKGEMSVYYDAGISEKDPNERLSGTLWITTSNFQILREKRTMTVRPEKFENPVTIAENVFDYQPSAFGILVPQQITHTQYDLNKKDRSSTMSSRVTFTYDEFTRPDVSVEGEVRSK